MRKLFYIFCVFFLFFSCTNVSLEDIQGWAGVSYFWARDLRVNEPRYYLVPAVFLGEGEKVRLYREYSVEISEDTAEILIRDLDRITSTLDQAFNPPLDVNRDNKVTFLFLDIQDGASLGDPFIAGYFDSVNFFADKDVEALSYRSNEQEILYIDTYPNVIGSEIFYSTLAHEYQHLLQYSYNLKNNLTKATWLMEALAEIASDIAVFSPQTLRLQGFAKTSGVSLIHWQSTLENYSLAYSFFRFLVDNTSSSFPKEVAHNPYFSIGAVEDALGKYFNFSSSICNIPSSSFYWDCMYSFFYMDVYSLGNNATGKRGSSSISLNKPSYIRIKEEHRPAAPPLGTSTIFSLAGYASSSYGGNLTSCNAGDCEDFTYFSGNNTTVVYNHNASSFSEESIELASWYYCRVFPLPRILWEEKYSLLPILLER